MLKTRTIPRINKQNEDKEKINYYQPSKVYSSFGKDTTNDYIALYVYDINDTLLVTRIMGLEEIEFTNDVIKS